MMGRQSTDGVREWWSRLGAWLGIYATAWMVIAVAAVYGPQWVDLAIASHPWTSVTAGGGWIGTVARRAVRRQLRRHRQRTAPRRRARPTKVKEVVAAVAPFVFIAGLLLGVAYALTSSS